MSDAVDMVVIGGVRYREDEAPASPTPIPAPVVEAAEPEEVTEDVGDTGTPDGPDDPSGDPSDRPKGRARTPKGK